MATLVRVLRPLREFLEDHTMALNLIDHTEPGWSRLYNRLGRENGAATYSRELVTHQVPVWQEAADQGLEITVSTCPLFSRLTDLPGGDVAVQYLHTYRYDQPLQQAENVREALGSRYRRVLFLTAYRPLAVLLQARGFEAVHLPMTIDTGKVWETGRPQTERLAGHVAWYGNITGDKMPTYHAVRRLMRSEGLELDVIEGPQHETLPRLGQYAYGVGVGRCALEMMTLGVRVMLAGNKFGGLITTEAEWEAQHAVNMNARVVTFDRDARTCVQSWDQAWTWDVDRADVSVGIGVVKDLCSNALMM